MQATPLLTQAPSQPASSVRRQDIQGLRAVAVLFVVAFHAGLPVPGGFIGVDVFFVISGFVITAMLHREWATSGHIKLVRFYVKRFQRLTPALAVMVTVTMVVSVFVISPLTSEQAAADTALGSMLLVANFVIARATGGYFGASAEMNPLLNTWSLSVEEQFYLIFPGLIALSWFVAKRGRRFFTVPYLLISLVAASSFALAMMGALGWIFPGSDWLLGFYSPFARAWEFAVGALLALLVNDRPLRHLRGAAVIGFAGLALIISSLWLITSETPTPGLRTILPVLGTLLLLLAGTQPSNPTSRLLSARPMVQIGDWSYSIYLWHWPVIVLTAMVWPQLWFIPILAALASLLPALLSYRFIEQPLRRLRGVTRPKAAALLLCIVVPPLAVALAVSLASRGNLLPPANHENLQQFTVEHLGTELGCKVDDAQFLINPSSCQITEGPGTPVYLVGDSNADQFAEGLKDAAEAHGSSLSVYAFGGCPFLDGDLVHAETRLEWRSGCSSFRATTLDWLKQVPAGLIVIANADFYLRDPEIGFERRDSVATFEGVEKTREYAVSLRRMVTTLQESGHKVALVQTAPNFRLATDALSIDHWRQLAECTMFDFIRGDCLKRGESESMAIVSSRQSNAWDAVAVVGEQTGSAVLDFREEICPDAMCRVQSNDVVMFKDYLHISVAASHLLAPRFTELLVATATS